MKQLRLTARDRELIWYALDILEQELRHNDDGVRISSNNQVYLNRIDKLQKKFIEFHDYYARQAKVSQKKADKHLWEVT